VLFHTSDIFWGGKFLCVELGEVFVEFWLLSCSFKKVLLKKKPHTHTQNQTKTKPANPQHPTQNKTLKNCSQKCFSSQT